MPSPKLLTVINSAQDICVSSRVERASNNAHPRNQLHASPSNDQSSEPNSPTLHTPSPTRTLRRVVPLSIHNIGKRLSPLYSTPPWDQFLISSSASFSRRENDNRLAKLRAPQSQSVAREADKIRRQKPPPSRFKCAELCSLSTKEVEGSVSRRSCNRPPILENRKEMICAAGLATRCVTVPVAGAVATGFASVRGSRWGKRKVGWSILDAFALV